MKEKRKKGNLNQNELLKKQASDERRAVDIDTALPVNPQALGDIMAALPSITHILEDGLKRRGINDPDILSHAGICEKSIQRLLDNFPAAKIPDWLRQQAHEELLSITQALLLLLKGEVRFREKSPHADTRFFEGYVFLGDQNTRIQLAYNPEFRPPDEENTFGALPGLRFTTREVIGQTNKGRAISGLDSGVNFNILSLVDRIRSTHPNQPDWAVYLSSGQSTVNESGQTVWKRINPLSQAIWRMKLSLPVQLDDSLLNNRYVFRYTEHHPRKGKDFFHFSETLISMMTNH